jgi:transposase-like protein
MRYRRFKREFKKLLVEQLLCETARPLELCELYKISPHQLHSWRQQYIGGKFSSKPSRVASLQIESGNWKESAAKPLCKTADYPEQ